MRCAENSRAEAPSRERSRYNRTAERTTACFSCGNATRWNRTTATAFALASRRKLSARKSLTSPAPNQSVSDSWRAFELLKHRTAVLVEVHMDQFQLQILQCRAHEGLRDLVNQDLCEFLAGTM